MTLSRAAQLTVKRYPKFYNNDFIKFIAENQKWSISNKDKMPVSIYALRQYLKGYGHDIYGASQYKLDDQATLPGLLNLVPNAANHAYNLDCQKDHWVVLDIEKTCPDNLKKRFLSLPYLYGEHSLSGKGIHLILPLPHCWNEYQAYHNMPKLQEKHKWFEILMTHWVTFTRNALPKSVSQGDGTLSVDTVFKYLTKQVKPAKHVDVTTLESRPKIPQEKRLLRLLKENDYGKTLTDFYNDESRFEFATAIFVAKKLTEIINEYASLSSVDYSPDQIAYVVYDDLKTRLPYRPKHDEVRQNMPWLLYTAQTALATLASDQN